MTRRELERLEFFAIAEPCENCGEPCEFRKLHEPSGLMIGTRCLCSPEPSEPVCHEYISELVECKFVHEIQMAIDAHKAICPTCNPELRKEAASETRIPDGERRTA